LFCKKSYHVDAARILLGEEMMNSEYSYKNVKISVTTGDITKLEVDAIVNPANSLLIMGGGGVAIKRVGGKEIEDKAQVCSSSSWKSCSNVRGKIESKICNSRSNYGKTSHANDS
jgi:hypothetical protein